MGRDNINSKRGKGKRENQNLQIESVFKEKTVKNQREINHIESTIKQAYNRHTKKLP